MNQSVSDWDKEIYQPTSATTNTVPDAYDAFGQTQLASLIQRRSLDTERKGTVLRRQVGGRPTEDACHRGQDVRGVSCLRPRARQSQIRSPESVCHRLS